MKHLFSDIGSLPELRRLSWEFNKAKVVGIHTAEYSDTQRKRKKRTRFRDLQGLPRVSSWALITCQKKIQRLEKEPPWKEQSAIPTNSHMAGLAVFPLARG